MIKNLARRDVALSVLLLATTSPFNPVLAQTAAPRAVPNAASSAPALPDDNSLTLYGVTLYGTIDVGIAYQTHGTPLNADAPFGLEYVIQKNSNKSILSAAPNGLSPSKVGIKGTEDLADGLDAVFRLDTGFVPTSGMLSNGPKSLIDNNGIPLDKQTTNGDSARAGQAFNGEAYVGLSSRAFGTLTFGRHSALMLDGVNAYDPQGGSNAFSVIGWAGATAGVGNTEDARLDSSVKYAYKNGPARASALYQFGGANSSARSAYEFDLGGDYAGFSVDALYNHVNDAISAAALSATQVLRLPAGTLAATISDNTSYSLLTKYTTGPLKLYGGYEHIRFENPATPLAAGTTTIGGYVLSAVNNSAYTNNRILEVFWTGAKYALTPRLDLTGAYYHYSQNSYKGNGCADNSASSCSGALHAYSLALDCRLSRRFDIYGGAMYSTVSGGLSSGYLHTSTIDPMVGARFTF
jgi:predicted porin